MTMPALFDEQPVGRLAGSLDATGQFHPLREVVFSRAPGRLDVMGGIADYSGSMVCELPLGVSAAAAVQLRTDGRVVCHSAQKPEASGISINRLKTDRPELVRRYVNESQSWSLYPAGCVWWLLQRKIACPGVTIAIDSDVPEGAGVSSSAAMEVAVMTALCEVMSVELSPAAVASACQAVENRVVGAACGVMDQATSCLGRRGFVLQLLCQPYGDQPAEVVSHIRLPSGYRFVGIDSHVKHAVKGDPYTITRIASFMGQKILSQFDKTDLTHGYLANVDDLRFRDELSDRLPERLTGEVFIDRYGYTKDSVTTIDLKVSYPIRAATAHHVYESKRVRHFAELLARSSHLKGDLKETTIRELGHLMLQSHASYGENAGLGHAGTDMLVDEIAALGPDRGFYGAKITGGGSGGTVAVLLREDDVVNELLTKVCENYTAKTGLSTRLFESSGDGAAVTGCVRLDYEELSCVQSSQK